MQKIEELYHAALDISPDARTVFVSEACGDDENLRLEINSLLSFQRSSGNIFDSPPEALAAQMFSENNPSEIIGNEINQYRIISLLGKGGMGEVYLAEDSRLDRQIAIKFLNKTFGPEEDKRDRFFREAKAASALNHPNIITVYEIGENDGHHFIATEFIDGQRLNKAGLEFPLSLQVVLDIAIQICSALQVAHKAGIVHRDIKPDNLMVRNDGIVKVLDFGLAKLSDQDVRTKGGEKPNKIADSFSDSKSGKNATIPGVIMGTPNYMSPEQANGTNIDHQTDIFSFGIVLYEMLTGELPFQGESAIAVIQSIVKCEPKPIDDFRIPAELKFLVEKCLKKDLAERYHAIDKVLIDLQGVKQNLGYDFSSLRAAANEDNDLNTRSIGGPTSSGDAQTAEYANSNTKWFRRNGAVTGSVGVIFLAIISFLGYTYFGPGKQIRSIAVMPIVNDSGNADVEYLSDGVTENLIRSLSNIPNLTVKARSTVFSYKGKTASALQIGKDLNVDAVLMGHLVQRGESLKLHLELVDTATQDVLWSDNYDRKMNDLVALQSEIARDVSERLLLKLTPNEKIQVSRTYTSNSEAHQLYLKGRFHWNKRNVKDIEKAIEYFDLTISKDPSYALAYSGLADSYALIPLYGSFRPSEYFPKAKQAALKALELDENLAEAHASLGIIIKTYDFDLVGAEREFRRAIALNPNYPTARQWYAEHLAFTGRLEASIDEISKALELDPFSLVINRMKGNILGFSNRHDEAIDQLNKTIELYPESSIVRLNLGDAFAAKGMRSEAVRQYLKAFELNGMNPEEIKRFETAYETRGWHGFWSEYLEVLLENRKTILTKNENGYFSNEAVGFAYAAVKNKEKAIEYLEKAYVERDPSLGTIKMSSVYDFLNDDQRYISLIKKIGLPE